jgi:TRAP-type C4-dicarboxylate transport system permease large subunit
LASIRSVWRDHRHDGELGLIHPPVGMNVFVIKSVVKDGSFATIFKGVIPFVATDLIRLVILIAFPLLATWLPQRMMVQ